MLPLSTHCTPYTHPPTTPNLSAHQMKSENYMTCFPVQPAHQPICHQPMGKMDFHLGGQKGQ